MEIGEKLGKIRINTGLKTEKRYSLRSLIEIHIELKDWEVVSELMDESFKLAAIHNLPYAHVQLH
ncbi:hypothetical protein QUF99_04815 [Bacillus sp. DX4.1]|uniref:hypothetical protein n=1 Tax=Bacillus sp. DX4.1 TaxID=3055867 RepID=UPI0025A0307C|nr:hypothetical protein [Bacillus sp. DX4.1]MDM5186710.1 hypothetical protein [Bacillus sp. DX4.1]